MDTMGRGKTVTPASQRYYHYEVWTLDSSCGELQILTGVAGLAAKTGHRLTILVRSWQATVDWSGDQPTRVDLTVAVDSIEVVKGEGGISPLAGPEKGIARSNALKSLDAKKFPQIKFSADDIVKTADGYRLAGTVEIHGESRPKTVDVTVVDRGDEWAMSVQTPVIQTEFGVKPYSLMLGAVRVTDEVMVNFSASRPK